MDEEQREILDKLRAEEEAQREERVEQLIKNVFSPYADEQ